MRKLSQREALCRALQQALGQADKAALAAVAELLARMAAFSDERDGILLVMVDAEIVSVAFPSEQAHAKEQRDAKRTTHHVGVDTRNDVEGRLDASKMRLSDDTSTRCAP